MNEYSWDIVTCIIISFTQLTGILIDEFGNEFLYFGGEVIGDLFSLFEEKSCGVLKFLHGLFIFFKYGRRSESKSIPKVGRHLPKLQETLGKEDF